MKITLFLYDGVTAIDVVGPYEVLNRIPGTKIQLVSKYPGEIRTDNGSFALHTQVAMDAVQRADVLIIPGSTISFLDVLQDRTVLQWIKKISDTTQYTCSVCTGSIILAATGLLQGRKATSHWYPLRFLSEYGVTTMDSRYVHDGKYITSAGATAGIDMAFYLTELIADKEIAETIQLMLEYEPKPPFHAGSYRLAPKDIVAKARKRLKEEAMKSGSLSII